MSTRRFTLLIAVLTCTVVVACGDPSNAIVGEVEDSGAEVKSEAIDGAGLASDVTMQRSDAGADAIHLEEDATDAAQPTVDVASDETAATLDGLVEAPVSLDAGDAGNDALEAAACSAPLTDCGDCVDTRYHPLHCGGCQRACSNDHVDLSACASGVCTGDCAEGFGDCNHDMRIDGCEKPLTAIPNCGACGMTCDDGNPCTVDSCVVTGAVGICRNIDVARCATPWAATRLGSKCAPSTCGIADFDGDGLNDAWETNGYVDFNCNGTNDGPAVDLPLGGADPHVKDVYLEIDYMKPNDNSHTHQPSAAALKVVVDAFLRHGVVLHIDPAHDAIPEKLVVTLNPLDATCSGANAANLYDLKAAYSDPKRKIAYHYGVFGHYNTCGTPSSCSLCPPDGGPVVFGMGGKAELPGNDFIVSLGAMFDFGYPPAIENEAGVLMHELGHNFGLRHGGDVDLPDFKPNYVSVMDANFTYPGIPAAASAGSTTAKPCTTSADCRNDAFCASTGICTRIDYSDARLAVLDEAALDEAAGVGANTFDITTYNCPDTTPAPGAGAGPIDWNCNGATNGGLVSVDITAEATISKLTGFNDWAALVYPFQCTVAGAANAQPLHPPTAAEPSIAELHSRGQIVTPAICGRHRH